MGDEDRTCETCRFYVERHPDAGEGACHRRAPVPKQGDHAGYGLFPSVSFKESCGEYEADPEPEPEPYPPDIGAPPKAQG